MEKSISVDCLALNAKEAQRNIRQTVRNREFIETGAKTIIWKNQLVRLITFRKKHSVISQSSEPAAWKQLIVIVAADAEEVEADDMAE